MLRRILHLDIDAFLASIEQLRNPSLCGRPVVVGTGVVASRSYEAKAAGVETAMPLWEARERCPELVVCAGEARLAERYRQRVAEVVRGYAPVVEVSSLDDLYADLTGVPLRVRQVLDDATARESECSLRELCVSLRSEVRKATGLSVAQGVGTTRTVARLATSRAKPGGICEVSPGQELDFLAAFDVDELPGVGASTASRLRSFGITTVGELRLVDLELLRQTFGARGEELHWRSRGLDAAPVCDTPELRSISRETSFEPRADAEGQQLSQLRAMLSYLVDRAATELRQLELQCRTVAVRLRYLDGVAKEQQRSRKAATDRTDVLTQAARELLESLLQRRVLVRLVGVTLSTFSPRRAAQGELFTDPSRKSRLFEAVDAVRNRHGFGALVVGESAGLLGQLPHGRHGFRLRTPSLTK